MAQLSQQEIIYILIVGSGGMLMLVGGIFVFIVTYQKRMLAEHKKQRRMDEQYSKKMTESQLESQERERKRIAADLHDSMGSVLWGAKLNASFLERSVTYGPDQRQSHKELMEALDQSLDIIKRVSWELTPQAFHQTGLSASVDKLCTRLNSEAMAITFTGTGVVTWNDDRALSAFRICQELVSNCMKHSRARHVDVSIRYGEATADVVVSDDGIGLTLDKERTGVGWWNIRQRVDQLGATINIGHPPMGRGTEVRIHIPLTL